MEPKLGLLGGALALVPLGAWAAIDRNTESTWSWPPGVVVLLLLTAGLYLAGISKMLRQSGGAHPRWGSIACFGLGWLSLVLALDSPIHEIGEQLFWVHMTQHEILMLVSAPLLLLGHPHIVSLHALSPRWRDRVASFAKWRSVRNFFGAVSAPLAAWLISAAALWGWHVPFLFDKALHSDWIHAAQHTTFLLTALLFWWPLVNRDFRMGYGGALVYVFSTALHTSILGALLTFAPGAWYAPYSTTAPAWHLTALEDQQIGGLIMWIPAGTLLLIVALVLLLKWLDESQMRFQYTRMAELARLSEGGLK